MSDVDDIQVESMDWFGSYLDKDGIVADVLKRVQADAVAVKLWLDPRSWNMAEMFNPDGTISDDAPDHTGCLMFAGMSIRNFYGLWHADHPHTVTDGDDLKIED